MSQTPICENKQCIVLRKNVAMLKDKIIATNSLLELYNKAKCDWKESKKRAEFYEKEASNMREQLDSLIVESNFKNTKIQADGMMIEELKRQVQSTETRVQSKNVYINQLKAELSDLTAKCKEYEAKILKETSNNTFNNNNNNNNNINSNNSKGPNSKEAVRLQEIIQKNEELKKANKILITQKEASDRALSSLQAKFAALEAKNTSITQKYNSLRSSQPSTPLKRKLTEVASTPLLNTPNKIIKSTPDQHISNLDLPSIPSNTLSIPSKPSSPNTKPSSPNTSALHTNTNTRNTKQTPIITTTTAPSSATTLSSTISKPTSTTAAITARTSTSTTVSSTAPTASKTTITTIPTTTTTATAAATTTTTPPNPFATASGSTTKVNTYLQFRRLKQEKDFLYVKRRCLILFHQFYQFYNSTTATSLSPTSLGSNLRNSGGNNNNVSHNKSTNELSLSQNSLAKIMEIKRKKEEHWNKDEVHSFMQSFLLDLTHPMNRIASDRTIVRGILGAFLLLDDFEFFKSMTVDQLSTSIPPRSKTTSNNNDGGDNNNGFSKDSSSPPQSGFIKHLSKIILLLLINIQPKSFISTYLKESAILITKHYLNSNHISLPLHVRLVCKFFAHICKLRGEISRFRVLIYDLLRAGGEVNIQILYFLIKVCPFSLTHSEDNIVVLTIEAIVSIYFTKYSESISAACKSLSSTLSPTQHSKEKLYFEQLQVKCLWDKSLCRFGSSPTLKYQYFEEFYKSKIANIAFPTSSTASSSHGSTYFFQALKAVELMSVHLEWDWIYRFLISRQLSPLLSSPNKHHSANAIHLVGTIVRSSLSVGNVSEIDHNVCNLRSVLKASNYDISSGGIMVK